MYFQNLPYFSLFENQFRRGVPLTTKDMVASGAEWHEKRAMAAIAWLESEYGGNP